MYNFQNYPSQNNETKISFWAMCEIKIFLFLWHFKNKFKVKGSQNLWLSDYMWLTEITFDKTFLNIKTAISQMQSNAVKYPWLCVTGINFKKQNLLLTKLISDKNESKVNNLNEKNEFQKYDIWKIDLVPSE